MKPPRPDRLSRAGKIWASLWMPLLSPLAFVALSTSAAAHESRPVFVEVNEAASQYYELQWKTPLSVPLSNTPTISLPEACKAQSQLAEFSGLDGLVRRISYRCANSLAGQAIAITYPGPNPSISSLIRYSGASGERHTVVLGPQEDNWIVPHAETRQRVARQYALLGIQHILAGVDHLLFVACLLWIAGTWRRILATITGFTVAHSATLILSALHIVHLPIPPVEAAIALSIVLLATEIVRGPRQSLTYRYPMGVSCCFGLLHGFGFAAALSAISLPQTELAMGLVFFNLGVEMGQVLFAAGTIGVTRLVLWIGFGGLAEARQIAVLRMVTAYAIGALAVFWLIERTTLF